MSTSAKFHIIYDGPALKNSEIDVRDLAPSLLAFSDAIEEANNILNRGKAKVALNIKASFKTGSFGVDLTLFQSIVDSTLSLFKEDDIIAATAILSFLGINVKDGVVGLIKVIKWIAGRKITSIQFKDNKKATIQINEEELETEKNTIELLESQKVRQSLEKAIAIPLETNGIESVVTTDDPYDEDSYVITKKEERPYFIIPEEQDEELEDKTYDTHLQLISPVFQEGNKWRFSEGNGPFHAEIKDKVFMNEVQDGLISFSSGDILNVKLKKRQCLEKGKIKSEYEVIQVLGHRSVTKQIKLPFKP